MCSLWQLVGLYIRVSTAVVVIGRGNEQHRIGCHDTTRREKIITRVLHVVTKQQVEGANENEQPITKNEQELYAAAFKSAASASGASPQAMRKEDNCSLIEKACLRNLEHARVALAADCALHTAKLLTASRHHMSCDGPSVRGGRSGSPHLLTPDAGSLRKPGPPTMIHV